MMPSTNILFITTDQQHWDTLSCLGSQVHTPNLDRLAGEGTLFTRAYCPNPTCTPSRASMITGLQPSQHGAWSLGTKLPEHVPTIGDLLAKQGYTTSLVGKAHFQPLASTEAYPSLESYPILQDLEFWRNFNQKFYGFDRVELARNHVDESHVGQHYALWMEDRGLHDWRQYFRAPTGTLEREPSDRTWHIPEEYHYNTWITERTNAVLSEASETGKPFFHWASFFDPHPAYLVPEPWASMYDPNNVTVPQVTAGEHDNNPEHFQRTQQAHSSWFRERFHEAHGAHVHGGSSHVHDDEELAKDIAIYYGMIHFLDYKIGQILDHLETCGLADNTIIVFTTDHGHFFGQHGLIAKGPFHYEDMLRIPMIVRWPGHVPAGRQSAALQTLTDLTPTWLDCLGLPVPMTMSGCSQRAVWCGDETQARQHVVVENRHQPSTCHLVTYIEQRYKITVYGDMDDGELFDLEQDPGEQRNLWHSEASALLKSHLLLRLNQGQMQAQPLYMPRIAGA